MGRTTRASERAERRRAAREDRRELRRRAKESRRGSSLRNLSLRNLTLAAGGLGLVGVIAFAILSAPPPPAEELRQPAFPTPATLADGMALGDPNAPLTIDLWSDFQCPACAAFTRQMEPLLIDDYVTTGEVRLVYHDLAFLGPESVTAARAARVAAESDLFWQYHDYLFANQVEQHNVGNFSTARLEQIATAVGLELTEFREGMADQAIAQAVADTQAAAAAASVTSTPTLAIGDQRFEGVPGSYAVLQEAIDQALGGTARP